MGRLRRSRARQGLGEVARLVADVRQPAAGDARHRRHERPRVGVAGALEDRSARTLLDDPPLVDDVDAVRELAHHAEVVGDEQHRRAVMLDELAHQLERLGLHRHVERGARLVGDEQRGLVGERHRDHHALVHPARKLEGVGVEDPVRVVDGDFREHLRRPLPGCLLGDPRLGAPEHFVELGADAVDGIERRGGVLKHHGHLRAPQPAAFPRRQPVEVAPFEDHAAGDACRAQQLQEPQHDTRGHRLAGAGSPTSATRSPGWMESEIPCSTST